MMFKSFTKREKILLVILVLILFSALYYFTVALPSINRISAANEKAASVQDDIMLEMAKMKKIKEMQEKIEEASSSNGFKTVIPNYNNLENVMRQMDVFLSSSTDYKLSFSQTTEENGLLYRPIDVEFDCANYSAARAIIDKIYTSPFKCVIDNISVDNLEYQDADIVNHPVKVTMTVIFIEKKGK